MSKAARLRELVEGLRTFANSELRDQDDNIDELADSVEDACDELDDIAEDVEEAETGDKDDD